MSFGPFPILLHATALSVMTYGYMALPQVLAGNIPIHELKGGHFQFLTIQGRVLYIFPYAPAMFIFNQALRCMADDGAEPGV